MTEDSDALADFNPDEALDRIRELAGSEDNANEVVRLFARLDNHLCGGCGALPQDWQPDPGVIMERVFRNQPKRTSRAARRR